MNFKNKKVWITGATSGIGEALVYRFAKLNADLIISSNEIEKLEDVKAKCLNFCDYCFTAPFDLGNSEEVISVAENVVRKVGRIDFLLNVGGISQRSLVIETPLDIDRKIMEIDYFGAVALTKVVLPNMVKNGSGHIVAISSIAGKFGFPLRSAYSAAKHALFGFFETLRAENMSNGIKVTIVSPGRIRTNISKHALLKDGKEHNQLDAGLAGGMPVDICAKKIIRSIIRNKKDILVGGKELLMVYLKKYLPSVFYRIVSKIDPT